jgi:DNA modification methylase
MQQAPTGVNVLDQHISGKFAAYHGDSCEVLRGIPSDSIHFSIYSPPFSNLFSYSSSNRDLGNATDDRQFLFHFRYIVRELYRVLMPGRLMAVHCMDLSYKKYKDGYIATKDFSGALIRIFELAGFLMHQPRVVIRRDPVQEQQRTKKLGLLHKQIVKDRAMSTVGTPDYLLLLRKPGANTEPIDKAFNRYVGSLPEPTGIYTTENDTFNRYSIEVWQRYAETVWDDIDRGKTLKTRGTKEIDDEPHICPLQLDVIRRALHIWTNPGDVVLSPFGGIGSEGVVALEEGRRAILIELKKSYYRQMLANLQNAEQSAAQVTLLDLIEEAA